jgi:hypothetical protein
VIKLTMEDIERLNGFCARVQDADYIGLEIDKHGHVKYSAIFENHSKQRIGYLPNSTRPQRLQQLLNEVNDEPSE